MKLAADLHIHSVLSPCGDDDMTPNNIVNMCCIKELDVISVTDHNSILNCKAVMEIGMSKGLLVIPGIEVTTKEEVHVLCYFRNIDKGQEFSDLIYDSLPNLYNNEVIFGSQNVIDLDDNCVGKVEKLLLSATRYTISEISELVREKGGIMVPAHIDKSSFGILSSLGFIPMDLEIKALEILYKEGTKELTSHRNSNPYNIIKSSDAHYLKDIKERDFFLYPDERTIDSVLNYLSTTEDK